MKKIDVPTVLPCPIGPEQPCLVRRSTPVCRRWTCIDKT